MKVNELKPKKILVVEDNRYTLEIAQVFLKNAGYRVLMTDTGEEAIQIAKHEYPDLILMDISLPLMDGLQTIEILKKSRKTRDIPIVAFTAHAMKGDEHHFHAGGCDGYIFKPFERKCLLEQVHRCLH